MNSIILPQESGNWGANSARTASTCSFMLFKHLISYPLHTNYYQMWISEGVRRVSVSKFCASFTVKCKFSMLNLPRMHVYYIYSVREEKLNSETSNLCNLMLIWHPTIMNSSDQREGERGFKIIKGCSNWIHTRINCLKHGILDLIFIFLDIRSRELPQLIHDSKVV